MLPPLLRIVCCRSYGPQNLKVLLAASGQAILCLAASDGRRISTWPPELDIYSDLGNERVGEAAVAAAAAAANDGEPPAKRRRLSSGAEDDDNGDRSPDIITANDSAEKPRRKKRKQPSSPYVTKLCVSSDGRYLVAVTDEDKALRVFELEDGVLTQISERQMPKKPNAVILSPDESAILAADKFGDVYSLPLLISPDFAPPTPQADAGPKTFKPVANDKTVHTRKNLIALRNQLHSRQIAPPKKAFDFEHELLLGHVSLLTDMVNGAVAVEGRIRNYLLTADRDEHIRVSRGVPQTHVIEGFCLGHKSFVNRLLIPRELPNILISGGGDDTILSWDWVNGRILSQYDLSQHVNSEEFLRAIDLPVKEEKYPIAVIGLHAMTVQSPLEPDAQATLLFVILEAIPSLFIFNLTAAGSFTNPLTCPLKGNPLDVAVDGEISSVLVAVDSLHQPGPGRTLRSDDSAKAYGEPSQHPDLLKAGPYVEGFQFKNGEVLPVGGDEIVDRDGWSRFISTANTSFVATDGVEIDEEALGDLFYGVEHMRKKGPSSGDDDGEE